jgi:phage terminase Nu1 subunit (DNA packaging protein)
LHQKTAPKNDQSERKTGYNFCQTVHAAERDAMNGDPLDELDEQAEEIARLRLTDEEREAIEVTVAYLELRGVRNTSVQDTLRGLLARTK